MFACILLGCPGHHTVLDALAHGQQHILHVLADLGRRIDHNQETIMATFTDLATAVQTLTDTVNRVAADLTKLIAGGTLTAEQQAVLDKAVADLTGDTAALDTADPAPAPPAG